MAATTSHHGGQDHGPRPLGQRQDGILDLLGRLLQNIRATLVTGGRTEAGHQQPQVIVDLGDRRYGTAWILNAGPLVDTDRRLQTLDQVHIGPLHLVEKLASINRQAFDVLSLTLGIQRVKGQAALARAARPGNHDQLVSRNIKVDILQVVSPSTTNPDLVPAFLPLTAGRGSIVRVAGFHKRRSEGGQATLSAISAGRKLTTLPEGQWPDKEQPLGQLTTARRSIRLPLSGTILPGWQTTGTDQ